MAKFNMKDYEDYMKEEERQDRLQEELEYQQHEDDSDADAIWRDYQRKQERQAFEDYEDDDCYYPECDDYWDYDDMEAAYDPYGDLLDDDVPDEWDGCYRPTAEDLYDMYANACEELLGGDPDVEDDLDDLIASENIKFEVNPEKLRISRKAVSRNRHHASKRAKKKAKKCAEILEAKFWKLCTDLTSYKEANYWRLNPETTKKDAFIEDKYLRPNEMYRLYHAEKAATKKANRVKTQTA